MWCCFFYYNKRCLKLQNLQALVPATTIAWPRGLRLQTDEAQAFNDDKVIWLGRRRGEIVSTHDYSILGPFTTSNPAYLGGWLKQSQLTMLLLKRILKISTMIRLHPRDYKLSWTLMTSFSASVPTGLARFLRAVSEALVKGEKWRKA